ncbi:MAG: cobaltochelatase subunit CobS, partial [Mesorhizobium sp.]
MSFSNFHKVGKGSKTAPEQNRLPAKRGVSPVETLIEMN